MTATQKYLFDLQGYLLVEDVLTDEQCETAKRKITERMQPLEKTPDGYDANGTWHRCAGLVEAGEPFISLIDHPKLMEVLAEIIGPKLRLESAYSFVRSKGCPQFEMHGGHRGGRVNFRYTVQGDRIFTETLAHGANRWQADEPRYGLLYKYNDRAATYHWQPDRIPGPETMATLTDAQRAFFNTAWEAFGPEDNFRNELPEA